MAREEQTHKSSGHEHYLSHILLLEQASPVALKAILQRELDRSGKSFISLINEGKDNFKSHYEAEYFQLFPNDKVNEDTTTLDTLPLCVVALVLLKTNLSEQEVKAIQCIYDLRKDIEKYAEIVSIPFKIYEEKQNKLHRHLLELIKDINDEAKMNCTKLFYSFDPNSLNVSENLIKKLKTETNVSFHLKTALEENIYTEIQTVFIEKLQDKLVYKNESVVLKCKLIGTTSEIVDWMKDGRKIEPTENLMFSRHNCTNLLVIVQTTLDDMGRYSCVFGNCSTSADLTVIDEALTVLVHLPSKSEVLENENIEIECRVNLLVRKPIWRYKGQILKSSDRYIIQAEGTIHKLTIMNVTFQEEGVYSVDFGDVSSKTTVEVQDVTDISQRKQIIEKLFRNWVGGALALKYLKLGLEKFTDKVVLKIHDEIMSKFEGTCNSCEEKHLLPHKQDQCPHQKDKKCLKCLCSMNQNKARKLCPNGGLCGKVYDRIVLDHRFQSPLLVNTNIQEWSSNPWSVATCYMNTFGYKGKNSAKEVDCSGLLSYCINNINIEIMLGVGIIDGKSDAFAQAREARNAIHHSPNYELSENQLINYIKLFKDVLEIQDKDGNKPLKELSGEALHLLETLQEKPIEINFEHEKRHLKEHGMDELEEKCQKGNKQYKLKLQQMREKQRDTESELQLLLSLKSTGGKTKLTEPFVLTHQIQVIAKNGDISCEGNDYVYKAMKNYIDDSRNESGKSVNKAVHHFLDIINNIQDCKIISASNNKTSTGIKIECSSFKAIDDFLTYTNHRKYHQDMFELRRWLHEQYGILSYDIKANCPADCQERKTQGLYNAGQFRTSYCVNHQNTQSTLYCTDCDTFFCTSCKQSKHGFCHEIKEVTSERFYVEQKRRLVVRNNLGSYSVKIKNILIREKNDRAKCDVISMCILPGGDVLLLDGQNKRLKKLNSSYKVVDYCDLSLGFSCSICYIGDNTAVVSINDNSITFVDVSGELKITQPSVELKHACCSLACHGDTLYVASIKGIFTYDKTGIFTYDKTGKEPHPLYPFVGNLSFVVKIAVSDDGERLYICIGTDIITIDTKGNFIAKYILNDKQISDICIAGEGIYCVSQKDISHVYQIDYNGQEMLGTLETSSTCPASICFDRERCRIIVSLGGNKIGVYKCELLPR